MKKSYLLVIIFLLTGITKAFTRDIRISLYNPHIITSVLVSCAGGKYTCQDDSGDKHKFDKGNMLLIIFRNNTLWVRNEDGEWFPADHLHLKANSDDCMLRIKPVEPLIQGREYFGDLEVRIFADNLQLINILDLEQYLMGVVEAEAGPNAPLGFYKVQSIICRTYTVKYFNKHISEGYNLCDHVHCQAYKGRHKWNEDVEIAAEVTNGLVLTSQDSVPINSVFHSNSGGETQGSENIWLKSEPYLKPVLDPFSTGMPNTRWEKSIPVLEWIQYLQKEGFDLTNIDEWGILNARQVHRQKYYVVENDSVEFRKIREDWKLKSAFFDIHQAGEHVVLKGKGYGHGVGLSQEGAVNMARKGYHYTEILNFYYHNIRIMNYLFLETEGKIVLDTQPLNNN